MDIQVIASGSTGNCYAVSDGETRILIECGVPFKKMQTRLGYSLSGFAGCLVSHEHADHSKAIADITRRGITAYMSNGTADALKLPQDAPFVRRVELLAAFEIGSFTAIPFDVQHDCAEPLGFLLESNRTGKRLVFLTDTYYCKYRFPGLTHIMLECNYIKDLLGEDTAVPLQKRVLQSHMSLDTCLGFLKANDLSRVEQIMLLHLSAERSDAGRMLDAVQRTTGKYVCIAS